MLTLVLCVLLISLGLYVRLISFKINKLLDDTCRPPGPKPWPILGDLHLLGKYPNPFVAFTQLSKIYGDIYQLTLGRTKSVIVNSFPLIKEVLITKGHHFGGRPDFIRFHKLFGGDRNNSLALCDWSDLQKKRRAIARTYCSPKFTSPNYDYLNTVGCSETNFLLEVLGKRISINQDVDLKPLVLATCANMFTQYMCSERFGYEDKAFQKIVRFFDEIFWEINQGYAVDFLPWLLPFYKNHMQKISNWAKEIRQFILSRIIDKHRETLDYSAPPKDFTDALLIHLQEDDNLSWEHIIFELEDFLGGHSAIGNFVMLVFASIVKHPEVGQKIQEEIDSVTEGNRDVNLFDRSRMPYTESTMLEVLRTCSSPIVPHVATEDTTIAEYKIEKGTVVFINNYELNLGEVYWTNPDQFQPERFMTADRKVIKPEYFIPFSTGKRTCIGQRLVQSFAFIIIASLLQRYDICCPRPETVHTYSACVALPPDTFSLSFKIRTRN